MAKVTDDSFQKIGSTYINKELISTISEYMDFVDFIYSRSGSKLLWYRGVSKKDYKLIPSIYRPEVWSYDKIDANNIFYDFIRYAKGLSQTYVDFDAWQWYQVQQHYGLPTRLLDWTEGSLIGLYFAVRNIRRDNSPAVWIIDPYLLNQLSFEKRLLLFSDKLIQNEEDKIINEYIPGGSKLGVLPIAILPSNFDKRLSDQKSVFTIHGSNVNGFDVVYGKTALGFGFVQLLINPLKAEEIKIKLIRSGISEVTLFPDLEGLAREIKYNYSMK